VVADVVVHQRRLQVVEPAVPVAPSSSPAAVLAPSQYRLVLTHTQ
jgi:hypothetical protein